jgi:Flp pilus assembly protein TadD
VFRHDPAHRKKNRPPGRDGQQGLSMGSMVMGSVNRRMRRLAAVSAVAILAGTGLSACTNTGALKGTSDPITTGSTAAGGGPVEPSVKQMATSKQAWEADRTSVPKGLAYAGELMKFDQDREALQVVSTVVDANPNDMQLASYYGKILIQSGDLADGEKQLRKVIAAGKADWRDFSALGSGLDQQGRHDEARRMYETALAERPNEISVLNNLGMSYALQGDLKNAEATLRKAADLPGSSANPQVRQNLALVVGLQGRYDEAQQIASRDLPPEQAQANVAYLRQMMSQSNTWAQLKPGQSAAQ